MTVTDSTVWLHLDANRHPVIYFMLCNPLKTLLFVFQGDWQCEVGGLIRDAFETDTATISLEVKSKSISNLRPKLGLFF